MYIYIYIYTYNSVFKQGCGGPPSCTKSRRHHPHPCITVADAGVCELNTRYENMR